MGGAGGFGAVDGTVAARGDGELCRDAEVLGEGERLCVGDWDDGLGTEVPTCATGPGLGLEPVAEIPIAADTIATSAISAIPAIPK